MHSLRTFATAGAVLAMCAGMGAAGPQSGGQSGSGARQDPAVRPQVEQRFEIPAAPWGGSSTARRLGVTLRELGPKEAGELKLPGHTAVTVESVLPKSAADTAGIRKGDVILQINGEVARSIVQIRRLVNETPAGQAASVTVYRAGRRVDLSVTPEPASAGLDFFGSDEIQRGIEDRLRQQAPRQYYFRSEPAPGQRNRQPNRGVPWPDQLWPLFESTPGAVRLGVVAQELEAQLADYFGVKEGVLVASVSADTPASRAGLRAGDVITAIDGKAVASPGELARAIGDIPAEQDVTVSVMRDRKPLTIKVKLAPGKMAWHV